MAEQLPITPALLIWARKRAGLTIAEAKVKFKHFSEWEMGLSSPTYSQLEKLADTLKVPIAVFFFPEPPELPEIGETFRTLPQAELDRLPSRMRLLLRKAKAMQLNLIELTQDLNPSLRLITRDLSFSSTVDVATMVAEVRKYVGVSIADQFGWKDVEEALRQWRIALQNVGVFVFKDAFQLEEYSGFCLYDNQFPIIYVNNSSSKTRQIFTYFHELAHLIFHTSGIDYVQDSYIDRLSVNEQTIEMLCNRFASQFLLPNDALSKSMQGQTASVSAAEMIASKFHVSREVVFRRFLDQGKITQHDYSTAVNSWNRQRQKSEESGGNYYWTKLTYLGDKYVSMALTEFHQNRIDETQLADYLDVAPKNVAALEEYFEKR